jgi:hypothetical protein
MRRRPASQAHGVGDDEQARLALALVGEHALHGEALVDGRLAVVRVGEAEVQLAVAHEAHEVRVAGAEVHLVVEQRLQEREGGVVAERGEPPAGMGGGGARERARHAAAIPVLRQEEVLRAPRAGGGIGEALRVHDEHARAGGEAGPQVPGVAELRGDACGGGRVVRLQQPLPREHHGLHGLVVPEDVAERAVHLRLQAPPQAHGLAGLHVVVGLDVEAGLLLEERYDGLGVRLVERAVEHHVGLGRPASREAGGEQER